MEIYLNRMLIPMTIAFFSSLVLLGIRVIVFKILHRWTSKTKTKLDSIIISSLRLPSIYWCIAIGIYTGIALSELPAKYIHHLNRGIDIIIIISMTIAIANLSGKLFRNYIETSNLPIPTTGLANSIIKGTIFIIGFLVVLNVLGISIAPLLTALGVGGLAVALALQDTLANLFAGIHILMEKSIRIGDFVKLETDQEGYVEDITWRTTRVKMLSNNMVIIPNNKMAKSIVTNYYLPEKMISLLIPVGVSYSSDPERVEQVLLEEALKSVGEIPGLLGDPEPFVRFIPGFGDSSLDFTLVCKVQEFVDQYSVQHELRKKIFKRFAKEGIEIPFPHRTVYLREEKDWKK